MGNRAGTPFRRRAKAGQASLDGERGPEGLAANTSVIKRPIVGHPGGLLVGFKESEWEPVLSQ